jgi:O-antigen/teichoic acid export membrane protein
MGIAFVPLYVRLLGIESYGLIGLYSVLQSGLALLDAGMKPALGREMSRYVGGAHSTESIRTLLRTVEIVSVGIAAAVVVGVWIASGWLASGWVQPETLSIEQLTKTFSIMGLVIALRFVESVYISSIVGLQRQVLENVVGSVLNTIRSVGAIAVLLWVSRTIEAYFVWQALTSVISVAVYAIAVYRALPGTRERARFSTSALREIWRFAAGMLAVSFLTLVLTQIDKVLLSRFLSLEMFGYYAFASAIAGTLYKFVAPIATTFYPRFVELRTRNLDGALAHTYHMSSQLISVVLGSAAIVMIVFADNILLVWTRDPALTASVSPLLQVLAAGTLLNGLMWTPYHMQLAYGWTSLTVGVNVAAVTLIVPALLWIVPRYGALGAAFAWLALNAAYVIFQAHLMHRRILIGEKWRWYGHDLLLPLSAIAAAVAVANTFASVRSGTLHEIVVLLVASATALFSGALASRTVRTELWKYARRITTAPTTTPIK